MKISKQGKKNWEKGSDSGMEISSKHKVMHVPNFLGGKKCCHYNVCSRETNFFIDSKRRHDISLNGLITMIKEFMHIVGGFWNPSLFRYGTKLVSVAFIGVNMLK